MKMLALMAALKEELSGMRECMNVEGVVARDGFRIFQCRRGEKEALLIQTGIGKKRAETAAGFVMEHYPVQALISFGFAGGLAPGLPAGQIVVCSRLSCIEEQMDTCRCDAALFSRVLDICGSAALLLGQSVTVARPASHPQVKRMLLNAFHADVVDTESYWIARIARQRGVPFLAVRAVSDTLQEKLPPVDKFIAPGGDTDVPGALLYGLSHPAQLPALARLRRNSRAARANLTAFLARLVERF